MNEPKEILLRHCHGESVISTVPKLTLLRSDIVTEPSSVNYPPLFCMLAAGRKRVWLGREDFIYGPRDYLITSAELPLMAQVIEKPYLGFGFALDPKVIAEILLSLPKMDTGRVAAKGVAVAHAEDALLDASLRMLRLLDRPEHIPIMAPMIEREIIFLLLQGTHGDTLRQLGAPASPLALVRRGLDWIRQNFDQMLRVEQAAKIAGMSAPTFHRHFRALTNMSPLQFQKRLRLQEARRRLLSGHGDAASVGFDVGYESASQFSREYRRMFGAPPLRDITNTRQRLMAEGV